MLNILSGYIHTIVYVSSRSCLWSYFCDPPSAVAVDHIFSYKLWHYFGSVSGLESWCKHLYCTWTEWLKRYFGDMNVSKMVKEHCLYFKWAVVNSQLLGKSDDRAVTDSGGREEGQGAACTLRRAVWQHWRHGAVCWGESCVFVQVLEMRLWDVNVSVASVLL